MELYRGVGLSVQDYSFFSLVECLMRSVLTCVKQVLALEMCLTSQPFMSYLAELNCNNFFKGLDTLLIHID